MGNSFLSYEQLDQRKLQTWKEFPGGRTNKIMETADNEKIKLPRVYGILTFQSTWHSHLKGKMKIEEPNIS